MSTQDLTHTKQENNEEKKEMSFLRSPARRGVLRVTGVVVAVGLAAAGSSAYVFAAGAGSGQKASGQEVSGRAVSSQPPAGLRHAADHLVADGVPGVIIMTRRGQQVSNVVAGLADKATGQPMQPQEKVRIGSVTKTFLATVVLQAEHRTHTLPCATKPCTACASAQHMT
jgi:CubicO group peptidase (beta-lactamase class C family)